MQTTSDLLPTSSDIPTAQSLSPAETSSDVVLVQMASLQKEMRRHHVRGAVAGALAVGGVVLAKDGWERHEALLDKMATYKKSHDMTETASIEQDLSYRDQDLLVAGCEVGPGIMITIASIVTLIGNQLRLRSK